MSANPRSVHHLSALGVARLKKPGHYERAQQLAMAARSRTHLQAKRMTAICG